MIRRAYGCSILFAAALLIGGCQALQGTGSAIAEGAKDRIERWWTEEGKERVVKEAGALAEEAKRQAVEAAARGASEKLREVEERLAGHGVEGKIDSLTAAWDAYRKVRAEEEKSGKPYQPVSGNLLVDIMLALFGARYAGKGVDRMAAKLAEAKK
jgi:hypothetical protein